MCAVVERLAGFERALEHVRQQSSASGVRRAEGRRRTRPWRGSNLDLPDGQPLMTNIKLSLPARGDRALGRALGLGKEHARPCHRRYLAVRAWRDHVRPGARVLFLRSGPTSDRPARDAVSYPMARPPGGRRDAARGRRGRVTSGSSPGARPTAPLALQLSPGEQTAHRFRAALVQKPDWLFLDEATSGAGTRRRGAPLSADAQGSRRHDVQHRTGERWVPSTRAGSWVKPNVNGPATIVEVPRGPRRRHGEQATSPELDRMRSAGRPFRRDDADATVVVLALLCRIVDPNGLVRTSTATYPSAGCCFKLTQTHRRGLRVIAGVARVAYVSSCPASYRRLVCALAAAIAPAPVPRLTSSDVSISVSSND